MKIIKSKYSITETENKLRIKTENNDESKYKNNQEIRPNIFISKYNSTEGEKENKKFSDNNQGSNTYISKQISENNLRTKTYITPNKYKVRKNGDECSKKIDNLDSIMPPVNTNIIFSKYSIINDNGSKKS